MCIKLNLVKLTVLVLDFLCQRLNAGSSCPQGRCDMLCPHPDLVFTPSAADTFALFNFIFDKNEPLSSNKMQKVTGCQLILSQRIKTE